MNRKNNNKDKGMVQRDDFQQIRGIGQSIGQALYTLGIYSYADLVRYTPAKLAELLKPRVGFITIQRIERDDWIGQARRLAQIHSEPEEASKPGGESLSQPKEAGKEPSSAGWREIADFFVSFGYVLDPSGEELLQTRVHHSQADRQMHWDGIATGELLEWMIQQAQLSGFQGAAGPLGIESAEADEIHAPLEEDDVSLELSDLWISEVTPVAVSEGTSAQQLRAEATLSLTGPRSLDTTERHLAYSVEIYLVDIKKNLSSLIESSVRQFQAGELSCPVQLDFEMPEIGSYQVYMIARLLPPASAAAHIQGPVLHIEP